MRYIEVSFHNTNIDQQDIIIALLADNGYEGFEQGEQIVKAFITESLFDENIVKEITTANNISYQTKSIDETNWNQVWESNFQPVVVDDFVAIRADFHEPIKGVEQEIVITPKMSFGTGHHATTFMMIQQMRPMDFSHKSVLDFGTGTGILSILAEKLGAEKIVAIDNDDWSIENARENLRRNDCVKVLLRKASEVERDQTFDIILANINKNVILDNFPVLASQLKKDGALLLSGLLTTDEVDISATASEFSLRLSKKTTNNNWISLLFQY